MLFLCGGQNAIKGRYFRYDRQATRLHLTFKNNFDCIVVKKRPKMVVLLVITLVFAGYAPILRAWRLPRCARVLKIAPLYLFYAINITPSR